MIVIDVGCATWGPDASVKYLLEEFEPDVLYGFDPGLEWPVSTVEGNCEIILERKAAWVKDGTVGFIVANLGGHIEDGAEKVECIDLARFILDQPEGEEIVLKIDAEGAEYALVPHLVRHNADLRLKLARIEWHCEFCGIGGNGRHREACEVDREWWTERRESIESKLRCPTDEWDR